MTEVTQNSVFWAVMVYTMTEHGKKTLNVVHRSNTFLLQQLTLRRFSFVREWRYCTMYRNHRAKPSQGYSPGEKRICFHCRTILYLSNTNNGKPCTHQQHSKYRMNGSPLQGCRQKMSRLN
ncbi:MAG: hypothetical protein HYZ34_01180 [Ignavibacteriae bacterium]|nr:hypothetical protein [Ignavibacteriota bacterium]